MASSPYPNLFTRLVANTSEPENDQACWPWTGQCDGWGYGRFNVKVDGKSVKLMAHVALYVCLHAAPRDTLEFWQAYQDFRASGLELDHLCVTPNCINPDHHEPVTKAENCQRRGDRRRNAIA